MSANILLSEPTINNRVVHGDWQTPCNLAEKICKLVHSFINPQLIVEPNCGQGAFLYAAQKEFSDYTQIIGWDINPEYIQQIITKRSTAVHQADFFQGQWKEPISRFSGTILVIGNPPWVTNSELMRRNSTNLPAKRNVENLNGISAITGKSNFDISQWMIQEEIQTLQGHNAVLAMLCKTATARRAIEYSRKNGLKFSQAQIFSIDAKQYFNVSVEACLLLIQFSSQNDSGNWNCRVYSSLDSIQPVQTLGIFNGNLVNDIDFLNRHNNLIDLTENRFCWRSGIKHDCAKIMELSIVDENLFVNGLNETVELEFDCLYPLLKSSDLANGRIDNISRYMIVPQTRVGQNTCYIEQDAPKTWDYLQRHESLFDNRKSSIYRNKPPFSIFGVGNYSFSSWKIAISGLYKTAVFQAIEPYNCKPVVFDDTCYFLPCKNKKQALFLTRILSSSLCQKVLNALIFWDAKRPVNRDILNKLNLPGLAKALGWEDDFSKLFSADISPEQLRLF